MMSRGAETENFAIVGKRVPLKDAPEKVTGSALFTGDMTLPGMLCAKVLRSPYAHAKVLRVDTSKAERLPGVKSVLSKNNAPRKLIPVVFDVPPDRVAFDDEVRFIGDEVAAVAAVTEEIAAEALKLIKVDYKELPAVFDPEEAIKPGAPLVHADKPGNITSSIKSNSGDVEAGFREADHVFEETFRTSAQRHACMETHGAIASFDPSGKLTVYTPSQLALVLQPILAEYLDMPMTMVSRSSVKPVTQCSSLGALYAPEMMTFSMCIITRSIITFAPTAWSLLNSQPNTTPLSMNTTLANASLGEGV